MALVLRLVGMLQERRDLDPRVRVALRVIEQAAADALTMTLGAALAGGTSVASTRRRIERLAWLSGSHWDVLVEGSEEAAHPPLRPENVSVRGEATAVRQLGDALLHLRREASRVTRTLTETFLHVQVVLFMEDAARVYHDVPEDLRGRVLQEVSVGLAQYLGRVPSEQVVHSVLRGLHQRGRRGVQVWEPMAELLSSITPEINPQTLRTNVKRWRGSLRPEFSPRA